MATDGHGICDHNGQGQRRDHSALAAGHTQGPELKATTLVRVIVHKARSFPTAVLRRHVVITSTWHVVLVPEASILK
ncbi:unnamed protein product, partial [Iphiclides podalirius]